MRDSRRLIVASYNVHCCIGTDGRYDPDRVARVIAELDADVVALQEVESPFGPHELDQLSHIASSAGFPHAIAGPTLRRRRATFGNAILTRWPAQHIRRIDLSVPGRERRGALDVELLCHDIPVRVFATHFGLRRAERAQQWQWLLEHVGGDATMTLVLLGDFNHWRWRDTALASVRRRLGETPALRTFPSRRPIFALDRLWLQPRSALVGVRVVANRLARAASDHLPLRAELTLN
jgi:endonuclease/exonuclease/phosphatase family metal-dependent hydrolase